MYALGKSWLNPRGPRRGKMKVVAFLMCLSLTILLSWRGPWCIKWCQCHKAEFDLQGDEAALHVCNGRTKGTIPPSWALKICFLNTSLLCPGLRKLFMLGENKMSTLNFSARLLFLHHTYFFHILPFMSCHKEKQRGRSCYQWVLKSHYDGKSQKQSGCVTSATCSLERMGGWVDTAATQDTGFPSTSSASDLPAAGNCFLNERQINGNIWQPLM